ncbi:MAG: helix-turn-helix domain-containing protein [Candidatus Kariarchaeaceae archaeon]|jgi:DNA-binding transcriptional MerR regulator
MFISIGQVAKLAGVSKSTPRKWEKAEYLPVDYRTKGNHRRYHFKKINIKYHIKWSPDPNTLLNERTMKYLWIL